ncbi:MAG: HU family DNA-binding protein [bacterium]|jgi:integration host factor subunit beta
MNKSQLIETLAEKSGYNIQLTDQVVRIFFNQVKEALAKGDKVEIRGFGSFSVKQYEGYEGRNPRTGEKVRVQPKRLPVFRPGKDLRERINGEYEDE